MFLHQFKYRFKTILHTKEETFWILLFPILLGTCFHAAFADITKSTEEFHTIDTAVVLENNESDTYFLQTLNAVSEFTNAEEYDLHTEPNSSDASDTDKLLSVTFADSEEADKLLNSGDVTGIITLKNGTPSLKITENGIDETILKEFLDSYTQTVHIVTDVMSNNGFSKDNVDTINQIIANMSSDKDYISEKKLTSGNTDVFVDYFYSLIAMTCLFASFSGVSCATNMKANLSAVGMRKTLSPSKKMGMLLAEFSASYVFPCIANVILIIYLRYILNINLGTNTPLIIVTSMVGSMVGIGTGLFIGSIPKFKHNTKVMIMTALSLFSSFLSGLMAGGIKYQIEKFAPIVNILNPATIITDALYSLNMYDTYTRFNTCMITLLIYCGVFIAASYFMTRRESYASL